MIIKLFKYQIPASTESVDSNYFRNPNLTCRDYIILTNISKDSFPSFNEEYSRQDDVNAIRAADYDLKFSLYETQLSETLKVNIKEFLLPDNTDDRFFKLLCGFEIDGIQRWGMVDLTSIKANYTKPQNKYDVIFTVYEIFKEFMDAMRAEYADLDSIIALPGELLDFDIFLHHYLNRLTSYWQMEIDNQLNLDSRCGFHVCTNKFILEGLNLGGLNRGYLLWSGLRSFSIGLGFAMRLEIQNENYTTHPRFRLILFWRTTSSLLLPKTVSVMEDEESNALLFDTQYLLIVYNRYFPFWGIQHEGFMGLLMERYNSYMCDHWSSPPPWPPNPEGYVQWSNGWQIWPDNDPRGDQRIPAGYVTRLELELHAMWGETMGPAQIPFCRILCSTAYNDGKFDAIIMATAKVEYQYLLSGVKEKRDLLVSLLNNKSYKMFDTIIYDNKNYWINKINDLNIRYRTSKLQCIRI